LALLEEDQRLPSARIKDAVWLTVKEVLLLEDDLHLSDFVPAEVHAVVGTKLRAATGIELSPGGTDGYRRNDPVAGVHDHNVVAHNEIAVPAPFRINFDQCVRNLYHAHVSWHGLADPDRDVDIIDTRNVAPGKHGPLNIGALFRRQIDAATVRTLPSLPLLSLTLIGLISLARGRPALPGRLRLILVALALALTGGLIRLPALLRLALFALALFVFRLTLLPLTLTSGLIGLPALFGLALFALALFVFRLTLLPLALTSGLIGLPALF
jgi:hypothetical protein